MAWIAPFARWGRSRAVRGALRLRSGLAICKRVVAAGGGGAGGGGRRARASHPSRRAVRRRGGRALHLSFLWYDGPPSVLRRTNAPGFSPLVRLASRRRLLQPGDSQRHPTVRRPAPVLGRLLLRRRQP